MYRSRSRLVLLQCPNNLIVARDELGEHSIFERCPCPGPPPRLARIGRLRHTVRSCRDPRKWQGAVAGKKGGSLREDRNPPEFDFFSVGVDAENERG